MSYKQKPLPGKDELDKAIGSGFEEAMTEHNDNLLNGHYTIFCAGVSWGIDYMTNLALPVDDE